MSILSSQADPPTLKSLNFVLAGARFLKNQGLGPNDALDGVWELSWHRFCTLGGLLVAILVFLREHAYEGQR